MAQEAFQQAGNLTVSDPPPHFPGSAECPRWRDHAWPSLLLFGIHQWSLLVPAQPGRYSVRPKPELHTSTQELETVRKYVGNAPPALILATAPSYRLIDAAQHAVFCLFSDSLIAEGVPSRTGELGEIFAKNVAASSKPQSKMS